MDSAGFAGADAGEDRAHPSWVAEVLRRAIPDALRPIYRRTRAVPSGNSLLLALAKAVDVPTHIGILRLRGLVQRWRRRR